MDFTYFGRRKIYETIEDINAENIVSILNNVLSLHLQNMEEEEFLFWF